MLVMLGNQVELWETMLAIMKLGAVIMPTSTAAGPGGPAPTGSPAATQATSSCSPADAPKFADVTGEYVRLAVGAVDGWADVHDAYDLPAERRRAPGTAPDDPLLLYFTSGTTVQPKLVEHTHVSYPIGHLSTMYWLGLRPGDVHLNISSPGWAKHAWSCFFAPWIAEATMFVYNYSRFDAAALLAQLRDRR